MCDCTSGSIERDSSLCCLLATSLSSLTAACSEPSSPSHPAALSRPAAEADGTLASASAASSLGWKPPSSALTSASRSPSVLARPEMKAFSQCVLTALKMGATSAW